MSSGKITLEQRKASLREKLPCIIMCRNTVKDE